MRRADHPVLTRLLSRGLLALVLVFAQQQAVLHWLSHSIEATHAKAGTLPAADHCDECVALGAMGAAATCAAPTLPLTAAQHALATRVAIEAAPKLTTLGFRSRAPPILS